MIFDPGSPCQKLGNGGVGVRLLVIVGGQVEEERPLGIAPVRGIGQHHRVVNRRIALTDRTITTTVFGSVFVSITATVPVSTLAA